MDIIPQREGGYAKSRPMARGVHGTNAASACPIRHSAPHGEVVYHPSDEHTPR